MIAHRSLSVIVLRTGTAEFESAGSDEWLWCQTDALFQALNSYAFHQILFRATLSRDGSLCFVW